MREISTGELMDRIEAHHRELSADIVEVKDSLQRLEGRVEYRDTNDYKINAVRSELQSTVTVLQSSLTVATERAASAEKLAKWAIGLLATMLATMVVIVGLVAAG